MKKILNIVIILCLLAISFLFVQFKAFSSVTKGTKIATYQNPQKALLVIDIQKAMTEKTGGVKKPDLSTSDWYIRLGGRQTRK